MTTISQTGLISLGLRQSQVELKQFLRSREAVVFMADRTWLSVGIIVQSSRFQV